MITSLQNLRVKDAVRLRDARHRAKQGRLLIDGVRELGRAITAGVRIVEVFVCQSLAASAECRELLARLPAAGGEVLAVSEVVMEKLAFGSRSEGVLAVAETPRHALDDLPLRAADLLVGVLEGVEKPGNVGAVARSADGAGLSALVVADGGTDLYNPNAIRASLGTLFTLPICTATSAAAVHALRERQIHIVAARVDGSIPYTEVDYCRPTAIVLGSEAAGLSALWSAADITAVRLPMLGMADSLNVSAAAAILFYEARRQRSLF
jgi:RNA methyltransferase, TrmH family